MAKGIVRNVAWNMDLDHVNLAEGESSHDYELSFVWHGGSLPSNTDLGLKLRCRNCGRVIPLPEGRFMELVGDRRVTSSGYGREIDYGTLLEEVPRYDVPETVGPFDVRYIYDDGSMRIRPLGHGRDEVLVSKDWEVLSKVVASRGKRGSRGR